ncbi:ABC transporter permease [Saccharomonospora xinjiangensis]|uniref:Oligopeptide transport system permease protein OppC n=1 Tax=Saccharomonospora xinjiangensis XJ-54 TaxID=882086 RepID=I0V547_9PSEU|nr:ABC transporter permease [Saccharomonospora xinjiangensis]EID55250.1 ABC-type dipeptide/oligopeptide/nickel transport system, permease component [Saccharomonospora xinjiangensis XJ-54]QBQ61798.1 Oligopeptide transport system permease protein OppC [Saccharomonospora xinjiangensis]
MNSLVTGAETGSKPPISEGELSNEALPEPRSQGALVLRKFLRHKLAMVSVGMLLLITLVALIMPMFWPHDYWDSSFPSFAEPSAEHPLGTTQVGKDMVSQILRGTQYSLLIAITVSLVATFIGVVLGAFAGYMGGFADSAISRLTDLFLIIPAIAAAAILVKVFSGSWWVVAVVLAGFAWMPIVRITRAEAMSLSQREFVEAARASGAGTGRIVFKHLVPNMVGTITVNATLAVAQAVLAEAALSFIGLGVKPPDTSLGRVISENYAQMTGRPWLFFGPFVVLVLISLSINFIGDGLRDAFDPRQRKVKA